MVSKCHVWKLLGNITRSMLWLKNILIPPLPLLVSPPPMEDVDDPLPLLGVPPRTVAQCEIKKIGLFKGRGLGCVVVCCIVLYVVFYLVWGAFAFCCCLLLCLCCCLLCFLYVCWCAVLLFLLLLLSVVFFVYMLVCCAFVFAFAVVCIVFCIYAVLGAGVYVLVCAGVRGVKRQDYPVLTINSTVQYLLRMYWLLQVGCPAQLFVNT